VYAPYRSGMWLRKTSDRSPGDLNGQIAELLGPLSQDLSVWESLADRFRADIFIGLFLADTNEGLTLLPSTMQLAAARRLSLGFDIYGHIGAAANPPVPESD